MSHHCRLEIAQQRCLLVNLKSLKTKHHYHLLHLKKNLSVKYNLGALTPSFLSFFLVLARIPCHIYLPVSRLKTLITQLFAAFPPFKIHLTLYFKAFYSYFLLYLVYLLSKVSSLLLGVQPPSQQLISPYPANLPSPGAEPRGCARVQP